ncbi:OmpA family protein [Leeuwenhoekiella sp. A16]|uniref:OmpA family protein n=1 Tax=Leeuwenhoekiella sp. A16 TaxID=3141462 RepID=UPI003A801B7A
MKIHNLSGFLLLFVIFPFQVFAQSNKIEQANKKFEQYAFIDAQKIYLKIAQEGFESVDLFQNLGDSYYFNGNYDDAAKWYGELITKYSDSIQPEYLFRYAQTLKAVEDYKESDAIMERFRKLKGEDSRGELFEENKDYLKDLSYIESIYTAKNLRSTNSRFSDFGGVVRENQLIFSSARDTGVYSTKIHKWNNEPFLDFYSATIDSTGALEKVHKFGEGLNSKFHESNPAFTNDGNTIYFTRNNYDGHKGKDKNGTVRLKIYKSHLKSDDTWSEPIELPFNSDDYSVAHPSLTPDNNRLYFSSDMPGTVGLSDIWYVDIMSEDTYGEPQNLGTLVNTEGRENFPFISSTGNLYFSSDGRPGLGGLDIYVAARDNGSKITQVLNLGESINSPWDDFSFVVDDATDKGYFSSNRYYGMGSDDLFKFERVPVEVEPCRSAITGVVKDKDLMFPIPTAKVSLLDMDGNVIQKVDVNEEGRFTLNPICGTEYIIRGEEPEYTSDEKVVTAPVEGGSIDVELLLKRRIKKIKEGDDLAKLLKLNPIYFDFDRFNIRRDAALELTKVLAVMESNPTLVIDVRAHTDSQGRDEYNLSLSEKRAQATVQYLINKGVSEDRITGKGYGETQILNGCVNGVDCTDEQQQINRRSEFIVISY